MIATNWLINSGLEKYFSMNLSYRNHPDLNKKGAHITFAKPVETDFNFNEVESIWNEYFSDRYLYEKDINIKSKTEKMNLDKNETKLFFLRYNYARKRVLALKFIAEKRKLRKNEVERVIFWGDILKESRDTLFVANVGLVFYMCKQYRIRRYDDYLIPELIAEAKNALIRSIECFDVKRGFQLSTYACRAIGVTISRKAEQVIRTTGREHSYDFSEGVAPTKNLIYSDSEQKVINDEIERMKELVSDKINILDDIEKRVIKYRFPIEDHSFSKREEKIIGRKKLPREELTLAEVGGVLNLSKEYVRQIQNRAIKKLKVEMEKQEEIFV